MRHFTFTSARTVISVASLLTVLACDDHPVDPPDYRPVLSDYDNMIGHYEGTVQGPGSSLNQAGTAELDVRQAGTAISGEMLLDARFGSGNDVIEVSFVSSYEGTVDADGNPHVILFLDNPRCGGTTKFTGGYTGEELTLTLAGRYVHRGDDCNPIATLDLGIAVHKTTE